MIYFILCALLAMLTSYLLYIENKSLRDLNQRTRSLKKQSEVRLGQIIEQAAPFLDQFNYDVKKCQFLGQPIDYVVFEEDEIIFVEVKTGKSRLSKKQQKIKENIENKRVKFETLRIK